jgi:hypothetical protein
VTIRERITAWIERATETAPPYCVGCGPRARDAKIPMMAGPEFGICQRCAAEALGLVGRTGPGTAYPDNDNVTRCHFCGTERASASGLVGWPRGAICRNCLDLGQESFKQRPR